MRLNQIQSFYAKAFTNGEDVTLKTVDLATGTWTDFGPIRAVIERDFNTTMLGEMSSENIGLLLLSESLFEAIAPTPKKGDNLIFRGNLYAVDSVDTVTYSFQGITLAVKILVGA